MHARVGKNNHWKRFKKVETIKSYCFNFVQALGIGNQHSKIHSIKALLAKFVLKDNNTMKPDFTSHRQTEIKKLSNTPL